MSNHDPRRGRPTDGRRLLASNEPATPFGSDLAEDDNEASDYYQIRQTQEYLERRFSQQQNGEPSIPPRSVDNGDGEQDSAWNQFYQRYAPMVRRYAAREFSSTSEFAPAEDIEDCVQDSLLVIMRALGRFNPDPERGKFRWWVLRIVRDIVTDYWRRRHVRESHVKLTDHDRLLEAPTSASRGANHNHRELLRDLLQTAMEILRTELSANDYNILLLRFVAGYKVREVAQQLRLDPRHVTFRLSRALKKLRETLMAHAADE